MRILIVDKFPKEGCEALRVAGHQVDLRPELNADGLPKALSEGDASVVIVRSTKVTRAAFESAPELSLVIRAGAGVNTIDLESASRHGVFVANCPGKNAIAVAELAFGLLLSLDRQIPDAVAELRAGTWNKKKYGKGGGVHGLRLGIVGFGNIGHELAKRAQAFGMSVSTFSTPSDHASAEACDVAVVTSLDDLMASNDVISVHLPYRESTRHMIGAKEIALMPKGAILLHTARGGVVDDAAVAVALRERRIRAGFDVFETEPSAGEAPFEEELIALPGFYATPHIGASTEQAAAAIADEVLRIVVDFSARGVVHNCVNVIADRPARFSLVVRHLDRVGVLAKVLEELRRERLNVQEMHNIVFEGSDAAASATISLVREPSAELLDQLRADASILTVDLRATPAPDSP